MNKQCFKCGIKKDLGEFYAHPHMLDGHLNKCKECTKHDVSVRANYLQATNPAWVQAERDRGREKYRRLYAPGKPGWKWHSPRWRPRVRVGPNWKSPPGTKSQQMRAHNALIRAVASGKIHRPDRCEDCGVVGRRVHGHHEDYTKVLAVNWVCSTCHRRRHAMHPERVKPSPGHG